MFNFHIHQVSLHRDALAREIAERSATATLQELGEDAEKMSPAELRGYVRGHAMPHAFKEAIHLVGREVTKAELAVLITAALDQVTHLVVRQFTALPVVAVPAPHIRLRIAA